VHCRRAQRRAEVLGCPLGLEPVSISSTNVRKKLASSGLQLLSSPTVYRWC